LAALRIAILTPDLDERKGGIERFCSELFRSLRAKHEVFLVEPGLMRIPKLIRIFGLDNLWKTLAASRELRKLNPDLLITNRDMGVVFMSTPRIHVIHGTMVAQKLADKGGRPMRDWLFRGVFIGGLLEFLSCLGASRVCVSQSCKYEVQKWYRLSVEAVIPNGVDFDPACSSLDSRLRALLFVGRPESRKGYEAAKEIAGELGVPLRAAGVVSDVGVVGLGILDYLSLQREYRTVFGMLLPSKHEACSYAILEALASGCLVFTTRVGWVCELLKGVPEYQQFTVELGQEQMLGSIISNTFANQAQATHILTEARDWMKKEVTLEIFSERWNKLIDEFLTV